MWFSSDVRARLNRLVRGVAGTCVRSCWSPASFLSLEVVSCEYLFSGLCGLDGDDVLARISFVVAGNFRDEWKRVIGGLWLENWSDVLWWRWYEHWYFGIVFFSSAWCTVA